MPGLKDNEIDMGFGYIGTRDKHLEMNDNENQSKESDLSEEEETNGVFKLEYDAKIQNVFYSNKGCLAVVSDLRFCIYYIYEEEDIACEIVKLWDFDYRFD